MALLVHAVVVVVHEHEQNSPVTMWILHGQVAFGGVFDENELISHTMSELNSCA